MRVWLSACAFGFDWVCPQAMRRRSPGLHLDRDKLLYALSVRIGPTGAECRRMLSDLRKAVGGFGNSRVLSLFGVCFDTGRRWWTSSEGERREPETATRRLIWLLWALVCRPGEVKTVWHLMTCGRTTEGANPATAGRRVRGCDGHVEADAVLAMALRAVLEEDERARRGRLALLKTRKRVLRILKARREGRAVKVKPPVNVAVADSGSEPVSIV